MAKLSIIFAAATLLGAGLLAATPQALAGGDLEYGYNQEGEGHGCMTGVRAVGRGWPFASIARRSAIKAWERESRYVHGDAYSYWSHARRQDIECKHVNGFVQRCEARANPCRT
jgi:hypothetical protein